MKTIHVRLKDRSYPIAVGAPLAGLGAAVQKHVSFKGVAPKRALIITNPAIRRLYGTTVERSLSKAGLTVQTAVIPEGERFKTLRTVETLYKACVRAGLDRTSCIVALGGGVVGDVAGFVAATYLRGVAVVQVPTSLLAMVDSSIGGKTGVDLPEAKNFVGAIHQPSLVWVDVATLRTLPEREFRNGMGEVIKYGVIRDAGLFRLLGQTLRHGFGPKSPELAGIIARCAAIKAEVVSRDEKETLGLREILNFGHTLGHAIETVTGYRSYKHGEAIAIGMCAAGFISESLGLWNALERHAMERQIEQAGLPVRLKRKLSAARVLQVLSRDKKVRAGDIRFVLAQKIGKVVVRKISPDLALKGLQYVQS